MHLTLKKRLLEGLGISCFATSLFLFLSLLSYQIQAESFARPTVAFSPLYVGGRAGFFLAQWLFFIFGDYFAYLFPFLLFYAGIISFRDRFVTWGPIDYPFLLFQLLGLCLLIITGCGLNTSLMQPIVGRAYPKGGILGFYTTKGLTYLFDIIGARLFLTALFLVGLTLATGISWLHVIEGVGAITLAFLKRIVCSAKQVIVFIQKQIVIRRSKSDISPLQTATSSPAISSHNIFPMLEKKGAAELSTYSTRIPTTITSVQSFPNLAVRETAQPCLTLSLDLLDIAESPVHEAYSALELETLSREVELHLQDFGIEVQVVTTHPGPVVTRFEMQPAPGTKVSRITGLAKDLARALSVRSVRIVEIIPGKSVIGLELPNRYREIVRLREILNASQYQQARSPLSLGLGKDIAGHPVVVDLAKMPHLLVAGTTGSGKSVGLNAMLLSLLYKSTPNQVRLLMIDPKMLELAIYEGIPHLLAPVVTDMKEAANALRWCVVEMERRYKLMAALGVRNLAGYNQQVQAAINKGCAIKNPCFVQDDPNQNKLTSQYLAPLPYILVLIDEFADLMVVVGKKIESLITRIAQKARAAGIHLILATQRPSVDVITGLIKANIPTRIAFQVSSRIDSRTILDQQGAEQLLGYGDMLYLAPGTGIPTRIHGAFVADHEVHRVVNALKQSGTPHYQLSITEEAHSLEENIADGDNNAFLEEPDPLYDRAVQIIVETRRASTSNIQRRLKIGYNRAARLMEEMEKAGLVSVMENNGNREVLIPENTGLS
jgi:DNA segregation ATPase FtsK/SpoIIIE, S-DNA-T family